MHSILLEKEKLGGTLDFEGIEDSQTEICGRAFGEKRSRRVETRLFRGCRLSAIKKLHVSVAVV